MLPSRFLLAFLLALTPAFTLAGCRAQSPGTFDAKLDRRIELLVRAQLSVPPDWNVAVSARTPSTTAGFDTLTLVFSPSGDPAHKEKLDFLLSKDNATLARLSTWSLTKTAEDTISTADRPVRGPEQAKVQIVNYDDLECPYCARMHAELFPETLDHYKGLVKIIYKDDPLIEIHPWALHASIDANCLGQQNATAYWHYVDYLHSHGDDVTGPDRDPKKSAETLDKLAREEGERSKLNKEPLQACFTRQDESAVRASMKEAESLHVDGTPTLFVNGERLAGAQPLSVVWIASDRALRDQGITPP
ncbi:MAG TPA: thioredoxin domain-containing protein, partial [Acidobacteriaceae bacterium]